MITIIEGVCLFCKEADDSTSMEHLFIRNSPISIFHKKCWTQWTCGAELREFKDYQEWRLYAGNEWDLTEYIWEHRDGSRFWYKDGMYHREDGPAIDHVGGYRVWYLNGKRYIMNDYKDEMNKRRTPLSNPIEDVIGDAEMLKEEAIKNALKDW